MPPVDPSPPAFPTPSVYLSPDGNRAEQGQSGMSLREWYAGQALAGLLAFGQSCGDSQLTAEQAAEVSFEMADAMLAEARKGSQS